MEIATRKLTETSKGSLVVCLPKWWTRTRKLERGSLVTFSLDGEDLKISPEKDKRKEGQLVAQNEEPA